MRIFLDCNGLLSYFGEDSDTTPLEALLRLVKEKRVRIFSTEQLENEYLRNVAERINQTRESIGKQELRLEPKIDITDKTLKEQVEKKMAAANNLFNTNRERRLKKYEKKSIKLLKLTEKFFKVSEKTPYSDIIIGRAKLRHLKGNPPKKKNDDSYGDAIHWESILEYAHDDDFVIVSHDSDFTEPSHKERVLSRLLLRDWVLKTDKKLTHYRALSKFINVFENKKVIPEATVKKEEAPSYGYTQLYNPLVVGDPLFGIQSRANYLNSSGILGTITTAGELINTPLTKLDGTLFRATQISFPDPIARSVFVNPTNISVPSILGNIATYNPEVYNVKKDEGKPDETKKKLTDEDLK